MKDGHGQHEDQKVDTKNCSNRSNQGPYGCGTFEIDPTAVGEIEFDYFGEFKH
jgi:hypothetical protein